MNVDIETLFVSKIRIAIYIDNLQFQANSKRRQAGLYDVTNGSQATITFNCLISSNVNG